MARSDCPFCSHGNPEGARFCNDCGSPLHLSPCSHCEAVNDDWAERCHRCGAPLAGAVAHEPATIGAIVDTSAVSTRDMSAPTALPHVPEAFGERLEIATWRPESPLRGHDSPASAARPHESASMRRVASRRDVPGSPESAPALFADITAPRRASSRIAPVLIAALLLTAGGGYLAYRQGAPGAAPDTATSPAPDGVDPPVQADASDAPPAPVTPAPQATTTPPPREAPAPAPAPSVAGRATPAPAREAPASDGIGVSRVLQLSPQRAPEAVAGARTGAPTGADESRSATETNRIIARELGNVSPPRASAAGTPDSRAAEETNRLIAREIGASPAGRNPGPSPYRN